MAEQLVLRLVALQDVDEMIREAKDPKRSDVAGLAFKQPDLDKLEASRASLAERIAPRALVMYEKIAKRYGRAVVPVQDRVCLGCFMALPTQHIGVDKAIDRGSHDRVETCENCGRILYWS